MKSCPCALDNKTWPVESETIWLMYPAVNAVGLKVPDAE
jgi:hypothetical protein